MEAVLGYISYQPVQRWCIGLGDACIPLSPHGLGTMLGFLLGAVLMARRAKPRGIPTEEVYNAVTWGALGAILGARGFYVLGHLDSFTSLRDVLAIWEGGLTMFGGFIGGLVLGVGYLWRRDYDIPTVLDAAAPGFVVGVAIGRMGDIVIADHLGEATTFFLGYRIPPGADLAPGYGPPLYVPGAVVHQTALYDLIGVGILALVLAAVARRRPPAGALFATFALWYGLQRLVIDFTRNREIIESSFFGLSGSQWAGLGFAIGGLTWLVRSRIAPRPLGEPAMVSEEPGPAVEEPASQGSEPVLASHASSRGDEEPFGAQVGSPVVPPEDLIEQPGSHGDVPE
ncbi:MAG TPA: prolipoprotein diacylglyceryl transferase family protein, partial [Actinomycetota bacterium]|nr:prolipoprotein diacylglyceryl transferase family protein [Actinomycetota bacterium]